jgi:hypothetical protein
METKLKRMTFNWEYAKVNTFYPLKVQTSKS